MQRRCKFENTEQRCLGMFVHKCDLHCSGRNWYQRGILSKVIINSLSSTCFSFILSYSELTSLYISTPYTCQVWIYNSIYDMKIADDIFKCIFNESDWISITVSMKFVPKGPIDYKSAPVRVMAWRRTGEKPLPEPMLTQFTDAYIRY